MSLHAEPTLPDISTSLHFCHFSTDTPLPSRFAIFGMHVQKMPSFMHSPSQEWPENHMKVFALCSQWAGTKLLAHQQDMPNFFLHIKIYDNIYAWKWYICIFKNTMQGTTYPLPKQSLCGDILPRNLSKKLYGSHSYVVIINCAPNIQT